MQRKAYHFRVSVIQGEWDVVYAAIKRCHEVVHELGAPRITTSLRVGTRTDREQTMQEKVRSAQEKPDSPLARPHATLDDLVQLNQVLRNSHDPTGLATPVHTSRPANHSKFHRSVQDRLNSGTYKPPNLPDDREFVS